MLRTPCWRVRASVAAVIGAAAAFVPMWATAAEEEAETELEEVQVTGTRIQVPGNYTAANPMVSVTGDEMRALGMVNVADALTMLVPQNISTYQPTMTGDDQGGLDRGSFFIGNTIANLRGMDPQFGSRTLTMVDGRRVVSTSNQADVVDINIIPSNLLQRMDVVTGGASATYGSGAMAGVVNMVLNNRMTGVNLDMDYGVNESGDGGNPHVAISGGMPLFGGRAHALFGAEWRNQQAIRDCAASRDWCAMSRVMYNNYSGTGGDLTAPLDPLPGFEGLPARFQANNVRFSQFSPNAAIYSSSANNTTGYSFTDDGTGIEEYAYGFRGGTGRDSTGGDGPLITDGLVMRPSTESRTLFTNFDFNLTERTTAYIQGNYAQTEALNRNRYTRSTACVRFNSTGIAAVPGGTASQGEFIPYGGGTEAIRHWPSGELVSNGPRSALWDNANFRLVMLGNTASPGRAAPFFVVPGQLGSSLDGSAPPNYPFQAGINPVWQRISSAQGTSYWNLVGVTLTADFDDPGTPAVLPATGRNAYAFLDGLSPEALNQLQRSFGNSSTAGGGAGIDTLYGATPCLNHVAVRKVWNPQLQRWTDQESETMRVVTGIKGRIGADWRWDAYYQYGRTESTSQQNNVATNLSMAFAMDAVIDDREFLDGGASNPNFGRPICRILRDGVPVLDDRGRPTSDPEGLAALASGCKPLNIFGSTFDDPEAALLQQEALAYAFKDNISDGANSLHVLSLTTSGTLWQGWAGPLTAAFGAEMREDKVDNKGSRGPYYARADIANDWGDAFGGRTRVFEGYTEMNLPLVVGVEGINLWSVNGAARYATYDNKGGAGTTGASATQSTFNWKLSSVFEPFDWVRFRATRSRDLRAAGYRDLFLNQPGVPDNTRGANPWRDRTADSAENQQERWGTISVGNADLKPEKSDTLTLGMVLSPGGWAQGMRISLDYYTINVKDAFFTPWNFANPVNACWESSGNVPAQYFGGEVDPDNPGVNGRLDLNRAECRDITFAQNEDGSTNLDDIVSINARRPINSLPYQRRGLDVAWNYMFPLSRVAESLPGSMSLTVRGTHAIESSGTQTGISCDIFGACVDTFTHVDQAGQIRSNTFIPGVSASPAWTGNVITTYMLRDLTLSLSARYIGGAKLDNTWTDDPEDPRYYTADGRPTYASVDHNWVKPYTNFALNGSYNLSVANMKQFQVFGSINNLFDKSPPYSGGGISGASAGYHDTMGRAYRMGVRMRF